MSLVTSRQLFIDPSVPVTVDAVSERRLIQQNLHRHEYLEMLFVRRGKLLNRFVSTQTMLKAGDILVLKPYVRHVLEIPESPRVTLAYCCSFLPGIVDSRIHSLEDAIQAHPGNRYFFHPFLSLHREDTSAVQLRLPKDARSELTSRFELLRELSKQTDAAASANLRVRFLDTLLLLADQAISNRDELEMIQAGSAIAGSRHRPKLQQTLNYIHDHSEEPLTLRDVAAMCGTSVTSFCQLFKHETGMTFLQYLNDLRIQNACKLLRESDKSIMEICFQVGFNDYSHFSRLFKKLVGIPAAEYRKGNF